MPQEDVVDRCNVDAGDVPVTIHSAVDHIACVTVEQVVVEYSDVYTIDVSVAVHIARKYKEKTTKRQKKPKKIKQIRKNRKPRRVRLPILTRWTMHRLAKPFGID